MAGRPDLMDFGADVVKATAHFGISRYWLYIAALYRPAQKSAAYELVHLDCEFSHLRFAARLANISNLIFALILALGETRDWP